MATGTTMLTFANKSDSLRTTVPASIVRTLKLRRGDKVDWELIPDGSGFGVRVSFRKS